MKNLIYIILIFLFTTSCGVDNSKIVGNWTINSFTINGNGLESGNYSNNPKAISIQFLDNGFFIMKMNNTYPYDRILKLGGFTSESKVKGKWTVKGFSKIELQYIEWFQDIGIQIGTYEVSGNRLTIKTKSESDFSNLNLSR